MNTPTIIQHHQKYGYGINKQLLSLIQSSHSHQQQQQQRQQAIMSSTTANQDLAAGFSALPSMVLPTPQASLLWRGDHAFFSAANASVILEDSSAYSFRDDWDRLPVIDSGAMGEEISRSPLDWTEDGLTRHLNFYFGPVTNIIHEKGGLAENWTLYEARVSNKDEEWASVYTTNTPGLMDGIDIQAPLNTLFHCDFVFFSYQVNPYLDCSVETEQTRSTSPSSNTSACTAATFQASDVYMAGFLQDTNYNPCQLEVYNPCRGNTQDGKTHCTATNGQVMCQTPSAAAAAANSNGWNIDQARESMSSGTAAGTDVDPNSRFCGVRKPQQQVVGTAPPTPPPTAETFGQLSSGATRWFGGIVGGIFGFVLLVLLQ